MARAAIKTRAGSGGRERKEREGGRHELLTPADPYARRARGAQSSEGDRRGAGKGLGGGLEREAVIFMWPRDRNGRSCVEEGEDQRGWRSADHATTVQGGHFSPHTETCEQVVYHCKPSNLIHHDTHICLVYLFISLHKSF